MSEIWCIKDSKIGHEPENIEEYNLSQIILSRQIETWLPHLSELFAVFLCHAYSGISSFALSFF